jgi:TonB family protein
MDHFSRTAALGAMGLLVATQAAAQGQPPGDTAADWLTKPTAEQVQAYYPNAAAAKAASGSASIRCTVTVDTTLKNCSVLSETPAGLGFGDAAVAMASVFRMKPAIKSGQPVDSQVSIPIRFALPESMVTNPDWRQKPSSDEMMRSWPLAAIKANKGGSVILRCKVTVDGLVNNCLVIAETPTGLGFGSSALAMAPLFIMKPLVRDGVPVGGAEVVIPISYSCQGGCSFSTNVTTIKLYRNVAWVQVPTAAQIADAYPAKARKDQMQSGLISLRCTFGKDGLLTDCNNAAETPTGEGLAAAAQKLSHDFRAPLKDSLGNDMRGSQVSLNFAFAPRMLDDPSSARGKPAIVDVPSDAEIAGFFPAKARAANVSFGQVTENCVVGDGGQLTQCKIQSETPSGLDFAEAAQQVLSRSRVGLWSEDGLPTLGAAMTLRIPVGLEKPGEESADTLRQATNDALRRQDTDKAFGLVQTLVSKFRADLTAKELLDVIEEAYRHQGQFEKAIHTLDFTLANYPKDHTALGERCWLKATRNIQTQTALADCDQGLKLAPKDADLLSKRGFAQLKAGDNAAAITDFKAALDNGPDDATVLFGRGIAKSRTGDTPGGKADMAAAKKLDSGIAKTFAGYGVTP